MNEELVLSFEDFIIRGKDVEALEKVLSLGRSINSDRPNFVSEINLHGTQPSEDTGLPTIILEGILTESMRNINPTEGVNYLKSSLENLGFRLEDNEVTAWSIGHSSYAAIFDPTPNFSVEIYFRHKHHLEGVPPHYGK